MYISGDFTNYAHRVHQISQSGKDLHLFEIEGYNYTGAWASNKFGENEKKVFLSTANSITQSGFNISQLFTGTRYF